ncbi:hypothetical protein FKW77_004581 [Venturia effusa]|uniref:ubiquitinyl hydrolase 1 n=1 Tax=Venturia effusa TaxID=50376 RepID=A0A517LNY5_9PEZI|nr:hypothetical protein FKW77_004581 [Venturia effusa]
MNNYDFGDAHYGITTQHKDSFTTNIAALAVFIVILVPLLSNTPYQDFARRLLVYGYSMASRCSSRLLSYTPLGFQRSVGDGSALKSVFGLDSIRSGLDVLKGPKSNTPPGLGNCNNSCYQNSIIQGLSSIRSFRDFLAHVPSRSSVPSSVSTALFKVMEDLNNLNNYGSYFWLPSALKLMTTFQQQDAQEYFSKLLGEIDNELAKQVKKRSVSVDSGLGEISSPDRTFASKSAVDLARNNNPLEGLLAQRVGCTQCKHSDGLSMTPFTNWTVPLGQNSFEVRDCFDDYTSLEYIDGVQCPKCTLLGAQKKYNLMLRKDLPEQFVTEIRQRLQTVEDALREEDFSDATLIQKCKIPKAQWASVRKSKQVTIGRAPKSLIVHINRSGFNEYTHETYKNNSAVQFPSSFNLDDWCLGIASGAESDGAKMETWLMDPNQSMLDHSGARIPDSPVRYELRAVVTHSGSHGSGHYICFRKAVYIESDTASIDEDENDRQPSKHPEEAWWRMSDENVRLVSENAVLQQGGVFMLFYERIDEAKVPKQPLDAECGINADVAGDVVEAVNACEIALPDDSDDEELSLENEEDSLEEEKPLLPPRHVQPTVSPPQTEQAPDTKADVNLEPEEDASSLTDSTTDNGYEDLFQSPAATAPAPVGHRVRMRTSSAFAQPAGGGEDPLQSPIRMGTAF